MVEEAGITLAIVTRDRAELFERFALPSLLGLPEGASEIVVVDQSMDGATRSLVEQMPGIRYLRSGAGLSVGRNAALDATSRPLVAFTDDDVEFEPDWLEGIEACFAADERVGVVFGLGLDSAGRALPGGPPGRYEWPVCPFGLAHGFNLALRRRTLDEVGRFDERLGAGTEFRSAEDTDMVYRVLRAGWSAVCDERLTVVHHTWRHGSEERRLHRGYGFGAGGQTAKHARRGDRTAIRLALARAGVHAKFMIRALLQGRVDVARLQVAWIAGLVTGFTRGFARRL